MDEDRRAALHSLTAQRDAEKDHALVANSVLGKVLRVAGQFSPKSGVQPQPQARDSQLWVEVSELREKRLSNSSPQ